MLGRHDGDADVEVRPGDAHARGAILRQTAFGDVEAGEYLDAEMTACGGAPAGAGTARSSPSTRSRTTIPVRNGSMWMSLARNSTARSSMSLSARTTGAPLARSRRLSMSSSD
jgi:hypothetical protein